MTQGAPFYGRQRELGLLKGLLKKKSASLVVIKGRRRIGKSRLAEEFAGGIKTSFFVGLPPESGVTAQAQRADFAKQLERELGIVGLKADDWGDLFWHLAKGLGQGRRLVILDEINWMGSEDPTFLGKLKTAWDRYFKSNPQMILILSGSVSSWIERHIIKSTGFFGRISLDLTLEELSLAECNLFWGSQKDRVSGYEKFKILSVTGGVPRYLEELEPRQSAEENLRRLCFQKEGFLFSEFDRIFSDLFKRREESFRKILMRLVHGNADMAEICKALGMEKGGTVSAYLEELVSIGYVARDFSWNLSTAGESKLSLFRLKDNYLRFYLRYIEPNKQAILRGNFKFPIGFESILGFAFENLVLNNRSTLQDKLGVNPSEILYDNPFFQRKTVQQPGCQIDYMIQTKYNTLYVCEVKFSKNKIGSEVIAEVKSKMEKMKTPKQFSFRPVLVHVNGVTDDLIESDYFSQIVRMDQFLVS